MAQQLACLIISRGIRQLWPAHYMVPRVDKQNHLNEGCVIQLGCRLIFLGVMQLPLRCLHRVLHFFEAVATSRTCLLIKRKTSIDPDMQMMWGRHLKAVLDGVILQDTVHYFSLDVEQKILQCFILGRPPESPPSFRNAQFAEVFSIDLSLVQLPNLRTGFLALGRSQAWELHPGSLRLELWVQQHREYWVWQKN